MRSLLVLALAGCVDYDLCAGHDGTCIGVVVQGAGSVDQLRVQLAGSARLDGRTPDPPGAPRTLPVSTALFLPPVGGAVDLSVSGLLGGNLVGGGVTTVLVRPRQHQNVTVMLLAVRGDLGAGDLKDSAVGDLSEADLSQPDLSEPDLSQPDLSEPDLSEPDLSGPPPRYVFLLPARGSTLGVHTVVDGLCELAAAGAGLPMTPYRAVIAYPPSDNPADYLSLAEHRNIVLPGGTKVATDDDFFNTTGDHLAAIDQLADGTTVVSGCAFTNFTRSGFRINSPSDCAGWSTSADTSNGTTGDVKASDSQWSFQTPIQSCDLLSCHVYCIQQ